MPRIENDVLQLRALVEGQAQEIIELRATVNRLVDALCAKSILERTELRPTDPPPVFPPSMATYRDPEPDEPTPEMEAEARKLLDAAQDHHFSKRFAEATLIYQQLVTEYPDTRQAVVASQQLVNLKA